MKANRAALRHDEAVSPVIATILMVAITVVLAATVYVFVTGFGNQQTQIVTAVFTAKAVDYPLGASGVKDGDSSDDSIEVTYTSGSTDFTNAEVQIVLDGTVLSWDATANNFYQGGAFSATTIQLCTNSAGNDGNDNWERGASVYLIRVSATAVATDCDVPDAASDFASGTNSLDNVHLLKVTARGQVVLDTELEVHDDASS